MSDIAKKFVNQFLEFHRGTVRDTVAELGESDALAFIEFYQDCMELSFAVQEKYPNALVESLVAFSLIPIQTAIHGMQFDFLHGRYAEVGRALRFVWELLFRFYYADCFTRLRPNDPNLPGESADDKLDWLDKRRPLSFETVVGPITDSLFHNGKEEKAGQEFKPTWGRLNEVAHPSTTWLLSGLNDSTRITFNHFDRQLALQLLDDAREVFGLMWFAVLHRFPNILPVLSDTTCLFTETPQVRAIIDRVLSEETSGSPTGREQ